MRASAWTEEDRVLILAWRTYQASLCPGCGHPKATAWHPDNDGWIKQVDEITCWGCTAARKRLEDGRLDEVTYPVIVDERNYDANPLPAWTTKT